MTQEIQKTNEVVPAVSESTALIQVIERAAQNPDVDIEKMERLLAMHERLVQREAQMAYDTAMGMAQAEMEPVRKDAENPSTRSKYASHAALDRDIRPIYTGHGFSVSYDTGDGAPPDHVRVLAYVSHRAGHSKTHKLDVPADGKGAKGGDVMTKTHATGSALSYGKRYLLQAIFNIIVGGMDDDGNAAASTSPRISAEQIKELNRIADSVGANEKKFFEYVGVQDWFEIRVNQFERAKEILLAKGAKK